jgi:hypothetical protein
VAAAAAAAANAVATLNEVVEAMPKEVEGVAGSAVVVRAVAG